MLKAAATRGPWPPLASARWGVRRRTDRSIVVASWSSGVEVVWGPGWWHATASRVWRMPSETRMTQRRRWRGAMPRGAMPGHGWEGASEVHRMWWGRRRRRRAHSHWHTSSSMTSEIWVRPQSPHSSHMCKSIHSSILPSSTPSFSKWYKAFHHAPPTTHAAPIHPTPTAADFKTPTPSFVFWFGPLSFTVGRFRYLFFCVCIHFSRCCGRGRSKKCDK